ncbi:MAG: DUF429 domain-containing protein [Candidatus Korarchaeota archaeon]|nr:DUF429 domain-containing protein [Candidatus Korarchaeota archaeon]
MYNVIIGLDLAGSENRQSGFCLIQDNEIIDYGILFTDKQIISFIGEKNPDLIAIDAPFNLPKKGNFRDCDLLMKEIGLHPFPPTMSGMRLLVERVNRLLKIFREKNIEAIEVFPAGAIRFLGFKRKPKSITERVKYLREIISFIGLKSRRYIGRIRPDEFDAIICAITGYAYATQNYIEITGEECTVIFPIEMTKWYK